ncbi:hypothetical protein S14_182 [Shewanella sp. phage 1/4]|uniref:hypothetical protein n=1 Tax=Shewanella phage 1/4 TaxID=1458859 RepID=UPI0004F6D726|nr:hypothetical protein S14_182 [Shewanella sp. phage 1/4]AHK11291.1 hypothetical protein S14_182 [Shewanella sp. phage 1/4]
MTDKFAVTEVDGVKQVGFNGAMGISVLTVEEIVHMMNGFNNTCIRLEERVGELDNMIKVVNDMTAREAQEPQLVLCGAIKRPQTVVVGL